MEDFSGFMEYDVCYSFKRVHDSAISKRNIDLQKYDITVAQLRVIHYLVFQGNRAVSKKELESRFDVTHPTMIGILKRLERKGFISSEISSHDKRIREVSLTEKGKALQAELWENREKMASVMLEGFSEEERATLANMLKRIYENIKSDPILTEKEITNL